MNLRDTKIFLQCERGGTFLTTFSICAPIVAVVFLGLVVLLFQYYGQAGVVMFNHMFVKTITLPQITTIEPDPTAAGQLKLKSALTWTPQSGAIGFRIFNKTYDQCQSWAPTMTGNSCPANMTTASSLFPWSAMVAPSIAQNQSNPNFVSLPFELYSTSPSDPSFIEVQALPMVGMRRGCLEPFNESGADIDPSNLVATNNCQIVRPIYWQLPAKIDSDGDGKEDPTFFKAYDPNDNNPNHIDYIIYLSGQGYAAPAGIKFLSLDSGVCTSNGLSDVPFAADFDDDQRTDFGVYFPCNGIYRIAFSTQNYEVIGDGQIGPSDSNGVLGLIPIGGRFDEASPAAQLLVVQTGGSQGERYNSWLSDPIGLPIPTADFSLGGASALTDYKFKPHPGMSAVPAAADYDNDGIVEMGWLSWSNSNIAESLGGLHRNPDEAQAVTLFPDPNGSYNKLDDIHPNPFAIAIDKFDKLYYADSVDGRVWQIDSSGGQIGKGKPQLLINNQAPYNQHTEIDFPRENVWAIPDNSSNAALASDAGATAEQMILKSPRGIVAGPDGAIYVADYQGGRIIRIYNGGNAVTPDSPANVVVGSLPCGLSVPYAYCDFDLSVLDTVNHPPISNAAIVAPPGLRFYKAIIHPMALAIVPVSQNSDEYDLAFSDGFGVYLIRHDGASVGLANGNGPRGAANEDLIKLAGSHSSAVAVGTTLVPATSASLYVSLAANSNICPILDLDFDYKKWTASPSVSSLVAASSCSVPARPGVAPQYSGGAGGIIRITSSSSANWASSTFANNQIEVLAGNFQAGLTMVGAYRPYAQPDLTNGGAYKRLIDLTPGIDPRKVDIINPTALKIMPDGSVLFINQWNSDKMIYPTGTTDRMHLQGIYRLAFQSDVPHSIEPLTNPTQYGDFTVPTQSLDWFSPYTDASNVYHRYIKAYPAPVKNSAVSASASLALNLSETNAELFVSAPFLRNPDAYVNGAQPNDPYWVDMRSVGSIYKISLDSDGDGVLDYRKDLAVSHAWQTNGALLDTDIDGDGQNNSSGLGGELSTSNRSIYCPEITGNENVACRVQERLGNPKQYFFRLDGQKIDIPDSAGGNYRSVDYVEFDLTNSISEHADIYGNAGAVNISGSRPESWALVFNYGGQDPLTGVADTSNNNGPIAFAAPLHTFVGRETAQEYLGYPYYSFSDNDGSNLTNQFLYPLISSSLRPRENGIKIPKRVPLDYFDGNYGTENHIARRSGILCWDYNSQSAASSTNPFSFDSSNYLFSYFYSAADFSIDNTMLQSLAQCAVTPNLGSSRMAAVAPLVMYLSHEDERKFALKDLDQNSPAEGIRPSTWLTGTTVGGEGRRMFYLLDLDGMGGRNPAWLGSEVFANNLHGITSPYVLASGGLNAKRMTDLQEPAGIFATPVNYDGGAVVSPFINSQFAVEDLPFYASFFKFSNQFLSYKTFAALYDANKYSSGGDRDFSDGIIVALDFKPFTFSDGLADSANTVQDSFKGYQFEYDNRFVDLPSATGIVSGLSSKLAQNWLGSKIVVKVPDVNGLTLNPLQTVVAVKPQGCDQLGSGLCNELAVKSRFRYMFFGQEYNGTTKFSIPRNYSSMAGDDGM